MQQTESKSNWIRSSIFSIALLFTGGAVAALAPHWGGTHAQEPAPQVPSPKVEAGLHGASELSSAFRFVASKLRPSVVSVQTRTEVRPEPRSSRGQRPQGIPGLPPEFQRFFNDDFFDSLPDSTPRGGYRQEGQGTGVIIGADGLIVTNNHVVRGAQHVTVVTSDKKKHEAKVIGADPKTDIAVIKIEASGLTPAKLGNSDAAEVGDWVVAVGSPFGLDQTVTAGIVSAKGRALSLADYEDFIQTDAAINPGNSGGPLLNLKGEIIGINTAIASRSGSYNGVGFAIPSNIVQSVVTSLTTNGGVVKRGKIGAGIQDLDAGLAKSYQYTGPGGALISQILPGSPAEKSGLKEGDIVTKFNGRPVDSASQFRISVATTEPGKKVDLEVFREGKPMEVSVTLAMLEPDASPVAEAEAKGETFTDMGIAVSDLNSAAAKKYDLPDSAKGVVITSVDENGVGSQFGLEEGDRIVAVGNTPIHSVEDYRKATAKVNLSEGIRMTIETQQGRRQVFFQSR